MGNDNENKQQKVSISAKTPKSVFQHLTADLGRILAKHRHDWFYSMSYYDVNNWL